MQLHDYDTEEIIWRDDVNVDSELADILDKMVCYDFRQRYDSAVEALDVVNNFINNNSSSESIPKSSVILQKPKKFSKKTLITITIVILGITSFFALTTNISIFEDKTTTPEEKLPAF